MCKKIESSNLEGRNPKNPAIIKRDTPLWELVLEVIKNARQSNSQPSERSAEDLSSR